MKLVPIVLVFAPAVTAPQDPPKRDPGVWPYRSDSSWNMPMGSGALYAPVSSAGFNPNNGCWANWKPWGIPVYVASATDPLRNIYEGTTSTPKYTMRVPNDAAQDPQADGHIVLIDDAHTFSVEIYAAQKLASGDWFGTWGAVIKNDIRGTGIGTGPWTWHGNRAAGISALGGLVRSGELTNGIRHAMVGSTWRISYNKNGPEGRPFVWPAGYADNGWESTYGTWGNLHIGSLLAIPPSVNVDAIPGLSTEGRRIARAAQDFGIYLCDASGDNLAIYFEPHSRPEHPSNIDAQLSIVATYLKVVTNNGPSTVGGGGLPRTSFATPLTQAPTVSISSPANGAVFAPGSTITINAAAADSDNGVSRVEFYQGGIKLGQDASAPFSFSWSGVPAGSYSLTARVYDIAGDIAASSAVSITVAAGSSGLGTGLRGDYYDNLDFTVPKLTRTDSTVNFDWGSGSPDSAISADTFSVRWTGQVQAQYSQTYTFYAHSDDGVRLWVNGRLLLNNWTDHSATENSGTIALAAGQKYDVRMDYYENGGLAVAKLLWSSPSTPKQTIPMSQLYPTLVSGNGLQGQYYDNIDFTNMKLTRTDATVNFNWASGSPAATMAADTFSVRWTGQVEAQFSQTYTFYTHSDDGVRLWVDGRLLINNWTNHAVTENSGSIALVAGRRYAVKMEFYERGGLAVAKLLWSSPSTAKGVIPQSRLFAAP